MSIPEPPPFSPNHELMGYTSKRPRQATEQAFREAIARHERTLILSASMTVSPVTVPAELFDPRWEWIDVSSFGQPPGTDFIRGACRHLELHLVESLVTGEPLARLCGTCDAQLPPPQGEA